MRRSRPSRNEDEAMEQIDGGQRTQGSRARHEQPPTDDPKPKRGPPQPPRQAPTASAKHAAKEGQAPHKIPQRSAERDRQEKPGNYKAHVNPHQHQRGAAATGGGESSKQTVCATALER